MKSRFPLSLENIPRQEKFLGLSLKFGSIVAGLLVILYSLLTIAKYSVFLTVLPQYMSSSDVDDVVVYVILLGSTISHAVTLFLSALMLVGVLREKDHLMRPWVIWVSIQVIVSLVLFVFWSTMSMINNFADNSLLAYIFELIIICEYNNIEILLIYFLFNDRDGKNVLFDGKIRDGARLVSEIYLC
ncbi:uncharacterized protein LOC131842150 isoform X1 [Achroia grisella]|uniref:uncharacterized protein LOC131842150 isoform X1 n=1 Tax=Achroia grisella TaxID=688607 RepID=UPI0027D271CD|nr:uncharacterized protein LOC131842150 isoform X1 [Achroia grisella]XP_059046656.1 uncharacterized protein LOC131842150 isoform X1 [Achroia grisella]XP_059046657.1 uncharacterized protein LOC131842150 isoform X1 [Achroia grisella]